MQVALRFCETLHQYVWSWCDTPNILTNKWHFDYQNNCSLQVPFKYSKIHLNNFWVGLVPSFYSNCWFLFTLRPFASYLDRMLFCFSFLRDSFRKDLFCSLHDLFWKGLFYSILDMLWFVCENLMGLLAELTLYKERKHTLITWTCSGCFFN